jgi:hypothetical protein
MTKAIDEIVDTVFKKVRCGINEVNKTQAKLEGLSHVTIDADFLDVEKPFSERTPKFVKAMKAPSVQYPKEMKAYQNDIIKGKLLEITRRVVTPDI